MIHFTFTRSFYLDWFLTNSSPVEGASTELREGQLSRWWDAHDEEAWNIEDNAGEPDDDDDLPGKSSRAVSLWEEGFVHENKPFNRHHDGVQNAGIGSHGTDRKVTKDLESSPFGRFAVKSSSEAVDEEEKERQKVCKSQREEVGIRRLWELNAIAQDEEVENVEQDS